MACVIATQPGRVLNPGLYAWPDGLFVDQLLWPLAAPGIGWLSFSKQPNVTVASFPGRVLAVERIVKCRGKKCVGFLGPEIVWGPPTHIASWHFPPGHTGFCVGTVDCQVYANAILWLKLESLLLSENHIPTSPIWTKAQKHLMWVSKAVAFHLGYKVEPVEKFKKSWSPAPLFIPEQWQETPGISVFKNPQVTSAHTKMVNPWSQTQAYIHVIHQMY